MAKLNMVADDTELLVLRSDQQEDIVLRGQLCIGRDQECDIHIPDQRISRQHAKISATHRGVLVEDLSSSNGTFINGQKIDQPTLIQSGDLVRFHNLEFCTVNLLAASSTDLMLRSVINGGVTQEDIALRGTLNVGRDYVCEIQIPDQMVSRQHARISVSSVSVIVEDLNSTNGTFVNGQRIDQPTSVKLGDRLKFHDLEFQIGNEFDPDVTHYCGAEIDPDATLYGGDIVQRTPANEVPGKKQEISSAIVDNVVVDKIVPEHSGMKTDNNQKGNFTAIQKQQKSYRHETIERLQPLKLGVWVEFTQKQGKNKRYCLVDMGSPADQNYYFVTQSGFVLIEKNRKELALAMQRGCARILDRGPVFGRVTVSLVVALSRVMQQRRGMQQSHARAA